jgi:beta-phosphoglucomutase-like phosphatase (HAD superfamily)
MNHLINNYDLFIFDLDDTIVKTEKIHYQVWLMTLQKFLNNDFFISEDTYFSIFHCINENSMQNYLTSLFKKENCTDIINFKNNEYFKLIQEKKK